MPPTTIGTGTCVVGVREHLSAYVTDQCYQRVFRYGIVGANAVGALMLADRADAATALGGLPGGIPGPDDVCYQAHLTGQWGAYRAYLVDWLCLSAYSGTNTPAFDPHPSLAVSGGAANVYPYGTIVGTTDVGAPTTQWVQLPAAVGASNGGLLDPASLAGALEIYQLPYVYFLTIWPQPDDMALLDGAPEVCLVVHAFYPQDDMQAAADMLGMVGASPRHQWGEAVVKPTGFSYSDYFALPDNRRTDGGG